MAQFADELFVLHADGEEEVAQQIRIGARGEERHVLVGDGLLRFVRQGIVPDDRLRVGAKRRGRLRVLQIEEQLRERVVPHSGFSPAARMSSRYFAWSRRQRAAN